ncbi:T9SS type A sorting domain-containing protein [Cyclobacterium sp. 1_MG-2023]|uniref:T9SS type A sorting domain-containing protein n=1 Tax=Cyclobacterium sp. 1_MG-2023 TaxID=3062681 RepID=UPI0026E46CD9|nr:T9SS type A sorting domain-containing protein [Cyclobacterium sp. 1_MG-2023]MDO6440010.1 T9SS type A sorting domain-containing protein [Cyclobacterium sp. 1_MG-2023]
MRFLFGVIIFLLAQVQTLLSQDFQWAVGSGSWTSDYAIGLTSDLNDNVYLCGGLSSGTTIGETTFENPGAYLVKFTSEGVPAWEVSFGNYETSGVDIAVDSEGNVYLAGIYARGFTYGGITLTGGYQSRIFVMKFTQNGELVWSKDFGTINKVGRSYVNAIAIDPSNNVYFGGNFEDPIQLGDSVYKVRGKEGSNSDMLLVKLSPDGQVLSVKNPGSTYDGYIYDIAVSDEGVYAVGYSEGKTINFDNITYERTNNNLGFIFKYNHEEEFEWANSIEAPLSSSTYSITVNDQEEAIITGTWAENYQDIDQKMFVSKVSPKGEILSIQFIDHFENLGQFVTGTSAKKKWDLATNGQDVFLSAGFSGAMNIGHLNFTSSGDKDAVIVKFNEIGFPQWVSAAEGKGDDLGLRLSPHSSGVYMAGHYTSDLLNFGDNVSIKNNSGNNESDFFLSKAIDNSSNLCPDSNNFTLNYSTNFCQGDSLLLSIDENPYTTYTKWTLDGIDLDKDNQKEIYITKEGVYEVQINGDTRCPVPPIRIKVDQELEADENTNIIVLPSPEIELEGNRELCLGDTIYLSTTFNEAYEYSWTIPEIFTSADLASNELEVMTDDALGTFMFHLEVRNKNTGCLSNDTLVIKINPRVSLKLESTGNKLFVDNDNFNSLNWFLDGAEQASYKNQEFIYVYQSGNYYVETINQYGCVSRSNNIYLDGENARVPVKIYPNPTSDRIRVTSNVPPSKLEVVDLSGKSLISTDDTTEIRVGGLANGTYILKVYFSNKTQSYKIVKH